MGCWDFEASCICPLGMSPDNPPFAKMLMAASSTVNYSSDAPGTSIFPATADAGFGHGCDAANQHCWMSGPPESRAQRPGPW